MAYASAVMRRWPGCSAIAVPPGDMSSRERRARRNNTCTDRSLPTITKFQVPRIANCVRVRSESRIDLDR
ncbi:hypothetical protein A0H81_04144 [Grifola frondosa]|uniref:Uncharacterized protein n=1 Tax=Grifola frondosa TaxID=5627 RepID=A0A1C7MG84_GRIFR|nr:hypothetical protein A0H81_04144 [Grifola frondosa]